MGKIRLICLALAMLMCSGCVKWRTHESLTNKFTVSIPGFFEKKQTTKKGPLGPVTLVEYRMTKRGVAFGVTYGELPDIFRSVEASRVLAAVIKGIKKKFALRNVRRVTLGGVPGFRYLVSQKVSGVNVERVEVTYLRNGFLYGLTVGAKKGDLKPEWTKKFFSSFRFTEGLN